MSKCLPRQRPIIMVDWATALRCSSLFTLAKNFILLFYWLDTVMNESAAEKETVRLGDFKVIDSCRDLAERHEKLHVGPQPIITCRLPSLCFTARPRSTNSKSTLCSYWPTPREKYWHARVSPRTSWGVPDAASLVAHYDPLHDLVSYSTPTSL